MSNSPLISVIVPVFQAEQYLARCVDSILEQTYTNIEVILVDDGSYDSSRSICEFYKNKDNRVIIEHQTNGGLSAARNKGIKLAKGEYLGFVDADDCIRKDMYEVLYKAISYTEADLIKASYKSVLENNTVDLLPKPVVKNPTVVSGRDAFLYYIENNNGNVRFSNMVPSALYKRRLFNNLGFIEGVVYEDRYFTPACLLLCQTVAFLDVPLYMYFQTSGSLSRQPYSEHVINCQLGVGPYVYSLCLAFSEDLCPLGARYWYNDNDFVFYKYLVSRKCPKDVRNRMVRTVLSERYSKRKLFFAAGIKKSSFYKSYFMMIISSLWIRLVSSINNKV